MAQSMTHWSSAVTVFFNCALIQTVVGGGLGVTHAPRRKTDGSKAPAAREVLRFL
jgi:hypothetical protein